jgi:hypothetical protein
MANQLPNTDDATVMRMAIAWEIVLQAHPTASGHKPEETLKTLTEAYTTTYNTLLQNEPPKGGNIQFKQ